MCIHVCICISTYIHVLMYKSFISWCGTETSFPMVKRLPTMRDTWVQSLGREDLLEKGMATCSSILASPSKKGAQRDIGEGNGSPLQYSCLENPMEEPGMLQSTGSQSQTQLSKFIYLIYLFILSFIAFRHLFFYTQVFWDCILKQ